MTYEGHDLILTKTKLDELLMGNTCKIQKDGFYVKDRETPVMACLQDIDYRAKRPSLVSHDF